MIPDIQEKLELEQKGLYMQLKEMFASCGIASCEGDKKELSFNLFHEIAHIIFGHVEKTGGISEDDERCAEEYAMQMISSITQKSPNR